MGKLFLFAIGGSGARVLRSFVFLLASGIELKNCSTVVPIFIDPDQDNGDVDRTKDLIKQYMLIRNEIDHSKENFYKTEIKTIPRLFDQGNIPNDLGLRDEMIFNFSGETEKSFSSYIDLDNFSEESKSLFDVLFSEYELDLNMRIGFQGNPNIGSIVLNQFKNSNLFIQFANIISSDDRVFIISSIFGGTGASGFPLLLKNLRDAGNNPEDEVPNTDILKDIKIGAVSLLPYFKIVKSDDTKIDSATFTSKTKAGLSYYLNNITKTNSINALYYIGDKTTKPYDFNPGGNLQKNNAHCIELYSAISIFDFMAIEDAHLSSTNGIVDNPIYREFGLKERTDEIRFNHFDEVTKNMIENNLTQLLLFYTFILYKFSKELDKQPWSNFYKVKITRDILNEAFYRNGVKPFLNNYYSWLKEMSDNSVKFNPFNLEIDENNISSIVNDHLIKYTLREKFMKRPKDFEMFTSYLNEESERINNLNTKQKFMSIFYFSTKKIAKKIFN